MTATAVPRLENHTLRHGIVKAGAIVADYDTLLAALQARNVKIAFGPFPARPGQRANVIIEDNAGNLIQFFGGELPASPQPGPVGGGSKPRVP